LSLHEKKRHNAYRSKAATPSGGETIMRNRQRGMLLDVSRRELISYGSAALAAAAGMSVALPAAAADSRFVFANESDYDTVDPHAAFDVGRVAVRLNVYDGLMRWQGNPAVLEPWVAESHTISPDGLRYTFHMRKGVKFHDGTEVKANDVVYSLDRILAVGKGAASLFKTMVDAEAGKAVGDYTVEFTLKKPSAIFLSIVPEIHIVNAALLKKYENGGDWGQAWLSKNSAGSGAYKLAQFDPAIGFVAERFPDHFKGWGPKWIDAIEFRAVKDTNTRVLGLLRNDFQGIGGYLQTDQLNRIKANGNAQVLEAESMRVMMAQFNMTRAPINDVHVRRAINYAFDYDGFNKDILGGLVERNPTPLPNTMWGVPKDVKGYSFDLEKAKAELTQAKVKLDKPIELAFLTGFQQSEQAAQLLQNGLTKAGVQSKVVGYPWPTIVDKFKDPNTTPDVSIYWISTYYADPHNWVGEMYSSATAGTFKNAAHYKNPKVDALLDKALALNDQAERAKLYEEVTRIVVDEAAGLWIYNTKWYGPYSNKLKGIVFCPIGSAQEMRTAYYES
jgi:peptide/nickel transport system substrate-binding protein